MASLNTLRTKFGIVLSVIIAFALLAFILSLKTDLGFSGNDPKVGVMDGDKIRYSEYLDAYNAVREQSGATEADDRQADMLSGAAWQTLVSRHVMKPGFEKMGITVTEPERLAIISGEHPTQALYQIFADPRTGQYNVAAVTEFLARAESDPRAQQAWSYLIAQARDEREVAKYLGLVRGCSYVNALEVANGTDAANRSFSGKWVGKKYNTVPDSLVDVSDAEIKTYYKQHREQFRQTPSRTLSYVVFEVTPTQQDMEALEQTVRAVNEEFSATDDLRSFVRRNRNAQIADRFVTAAQLPDDEAGPLMAGNQYGPTLKNNEWTMARVLDTRMVPDSLGIRHIVLPYTEDKLADSLLTALRGGADFAETARQYSVYETTAQNGGDVGVLPFSAFTGDFIEPLAAARQGDIVKIASGDAVQLMQIYRADKPSKHIRIASVTYPVEASDATRLAAHNQAGIFSVNDKGSVDAFNEAAAAAAVTPRVATVQEGERAIRGLEKSRELVRWANGAERNDISEIFNVGNDYVVAVLTDIDDNLYAPVSKVSTQIRNRLLRDKKYEYILRDVQGTTLDEVAASLGSEIAPFEHVRYGSFYVNGIGIEPRLIGAIAATTGQGTLSAPVKGLSGLYLFEVDDIAVEEKQTPEAERVRAQAAAEQAAQQGAFNAIQQLAEIRDLRGMYF